MIFACCHPALTRAGQVALTLKTLCGFNVAEIARAFLIGEETAAKRLTRARHTLQDSRARFEIPDGEELSARLEAVHEVLYLVFNEGYNASRGAELIRRDLTGEAIRLGRLLTEHPATNSPATCALLALFLLQAARFPGRTNGDGEILRLEEQDRSSWDKQLIAEGMAFLERAAAGDTVSPFHFEAGIAACHTAAPSYAATDWPQILSLYDGLLAVRSSPVIALNRAVALSKLQGPHAGLAALREIETAAALRHYHLLYAVRAELHAQLGDTPGARENYERALKLTDLPAEQQLLRDRLCALRAANRESS
jgi:RNA polymerase sigma-70 factor (ECF subfamily)